MTMQIQKLNVEDIVLLDHLKKALQVRAIFRDLGFIGQLRLYTNGEVRIQLNNTQKNTHESMRMLAKSLACKFDKKRTACGFLKYETMITSGVGIYANTTECFYGGKPELVVHRPRTQAICKLPEEGSET